MSDCRHLKPKICGNKLKPFLSDKGCGVPRFVGIEDVTINQGIGIDLTEGVYAYDGNGNEIEYTVTPDSIDMCDVGEHTVIYRAMAEGKKFAPWFCSKQRGLAGDLLCSRVALRKDRTVTIEQIDPPRIEGLDTVKISPNVEFDPTEGVTAIDGNGNEIEYTYSGLTDAVAEGAIASFETEFEQNAKSVLVNIKPVQNLNGYNNPWIGGSTKNKCSVSDVTFVKLQEVEIDEIPIGIYVFSAVVTSTDTDSSRCTVGFFDANKSLIKFEFIPRSTYGERVNTVSFYASAPIKYIRFYASEDYGIGEGDTATYSDIQIERGSTVTPYIPYENICPISGHTEVNVTRTGKSIVPFLSDFIAPTTNYNGFAGWNSGWEVADRTKTYTYSVYIDNTQASDVSYVTVWLKDKNNNAYVDGVTRSGNRVEAGEEGWSTVTLNFSDIPNTYYLYFGLSLKANGVAHNPIVELGSTASDYEPYRGIDYITQLGQTVYGGTLDVVTGKLVVDRVMFTLNTADLNGSNIYPGWNHVDGLREAVGIDINGKVNSITSFTSTLVSANTRGSNSILFFGASELGMTADELAEALPNTDLQLCIELAEPQTYYLTRQEVALFEGQNNVWSDSGNVRVVYQESMPIGESIEYETVGERIITYTATDICGNTSEVEREILVGITAQACKSQACGAFVYCAPTEACEAIVGLSATACE